MMMTSDMAEKLASPRWRLNNLYKILDKEGRQITFKRNRAQRMLYDNLHTKNVILKSRQLGFSTFIDLFILDMCLFRPGTEAIIIADTQPNAEAIFRRKVMYPYEHLPEEIRTTFHPKTGTKGSSNQLQLSNESVISVAVSARSATAQIIHSSELAKVAALHPDKAREFVEGTLGAASSKKAIVFIESTARGGSGVFYDYCQEAMVTEQEVTSGKREMHELDWKFHFFPWYLEPEYVLDANVVITSEMQDYFLALKKESSIGLTQQQMNWYAVKYRELGEAMWSEYPSTPQEAFDQVIKGAYFSSQFTQLRDDKRITSVPYDSRVAVDTWWDIGMNDSTVIWFTQDVGREIHIIDYMEGSGEGLAHYARALGERPYVYGRHVGPHDLGVRELGTGASRLETAARLGLRFDVVPRVGDKRDSIEAARGLFSRCWFDEENCYTGLKHLELYRKQWDQRRMVWKDRPFHDEHSNAADAFQTLAMGHDMLSRRGAARPRPVVSSDYKW